MPPSLRIVHSLAIVAVLAAGCHNVPERVGKSPLKPLRMSPDTVVLDVFFVRFPLGDPEPNGPLWDELDETRWPAELRQKLALNGFRVGLVGGPVPPVPLSKLLELKDKPAPTGAVQEASRTDFTDEPRVSRRHTPLHCGGRAEILASGPYEELAALVCTPAGVEGETYKNARTILSAGASLEPDGRVRLKLVPELHYGDPKPSLVGPPGVLRLEAGQPKRVFHDMTIDTTLRPGQMLVLSSLIQRPGSLGHYFLTQKADGRLQQKLIVIRLSQTQHDGLFDAPEPLPLDVLTAEASPARSR